MVKISKELVDMLVDYCNEPGWLQRSRYAAFDLFEKSPLPDRRQEEWKRTDPRLFIKSFDLAIDLSAKQSEPIDPQEKEFYSGIFHLGAYSRPVVYLQEDLSRDGVIFTDMCSAVHNYPSLFTLYFNRLIEQPFDNIFSALHHALWNGGTFVYVPQGMKLSRPLYCRLHKTSSTQFWAPHTLIIAEPHSEFTYFEERSSDPSDVQSLNCGAVEVILMEGAKVEFITFDRRSGNLNNISTEVAHVGPYSSLKWLTVDVGSRLTKKKLTVIIKGVSSSSMLNGLYFMDGHQHYDMITTFNHQIHSSVGEVKFVGACNDSATSSYRGRIVIPKNAVKTDSHLTNKTLLLSKNAKAYSTPILEISANDVKCKHASSQGKLDPEQIFYLMTRGINRSEAQKMITMGFFEEILNNVSSEQLRSLLRFALEEKFHREN